MSSFPLLLRFTLPVFVASGLPEGQHTLHLLNTGTDGTQGTDFDYAVVNSTTSPTSSAPVPGSSSTSQASRSASASNSAIASLAGASQSAQPSSGSGRNSNAPIIGATLGCIVGLALGALGAFFFLRRRRRQRNAGPRPAVELIGPSSPHDSTHDDPFLTPYRDGDEPPPSMNSASNQQHRQPMIQTGSAGGEQASQKGYALSAFLSPSQYFPPPPSTSYVGSEPEQASTDHSNRALNANDARPISPPTAGLIPWATAQSSLGTGASPRSNTGSATDLPASNTPGAIGHTGSSKSLGVQLPYTALAPLEPTPAHLAQPSAHQQDQLQAPDMSGDLAPPPPRGSIMSEAYKRMSVAGRDSDQGPYSPQPEDGGQMTTLPPNYEQATEPLPGQVPLRPPGAGQ